MPADRIDQLADKVRGASCAPDDPRSSAGALLLPAIVRLLAEGQPASAERVGQAIGLPGHLAADMVTSVFPQAEFDAERRLIGLGLSLTRTPHRVALGGRDLPLYAWCAPDALLVPTLLGEPARVSSPCRATGQTVTVDVGPEGVDEVSPPSTVVSFVTQADPAQLRSSACDHQQFFRSEGAARGWLADHPGAFTLPVADAFRLLARLSGRPPSARPEETVDIGEVMARLMRGQVQDEIPCQLIVQEGEGFRTTSGQPDAGDMWWDADLAGRLDSEAHRARGGGPHLVVRLPNDIDWDIDGPMTNGPGWYRTGEPPEVTVVPSSRAWDFHGVLVKGRLMRVVDGP